MKSVAVLGTGPTALMAATVLCQAEIKVSLFEKNKGPGRKLLIAGSSGLNITNKLPLKEFATQYSGGTLDFWETLLKNFSPRSWIDFIESLGIKTFLGTSGRYFVKDMKASKLLSMWIKHLSQHNTLLFYEHECSSFNIDKKTGKIILDFLKKESQKFDAVLFALGGGSYEDENLLWPSFFQESKISFNPFTPSNVGYEVSWKKEFLKESEGKALKNIVLKVGKNRKPGELVITKYGLEGTPIYTLGAANTKASIDLKPDLTADDILKKCLNAKENLSPLRRVKKQLKLDDVSLSLLFHHAPKLNDLGALISSIKDFSIELKSPRPLEEAISSAGGIALNELTPDLMLKKIPGVFVGGEMLDWDAPTGGFLIQACVSQGYLAGLGILKWLKTKKSYHF